MAESLHQGDLARVRPGERFVLFEPGGDGVVLYRGTMRAGGDAEMDVLSRKPIDPVFVTADELFQMYAPGIHAVATIGGAV